MKNYFLILFSLSLFLSEIILRINQTFGFLLYSFLIAGCLISLAKAESLDNRGKLIIVFMILPIIRIAELFLVFEVFWKTFIVYCILLFLAVFYSIEFKINPGYTTKKLYLLPLVIILSIFLGFIGNSFFSFEKYAGFFFLIPLIAYSEEVLFRGLIQNFIKKNYGIICSILFTAILYGIFSLSYGFPTVLFIFFTALSISCIYHFTENIFLTIAMNIVLQLFLFVFPMFSF